MVDQAAQANLGKRKRTQDHADGFPINNNHEGPLHSSHLSPSSKACRRSQSFSRPSPESNNSRTFKPLPPSTTNSTSGRPTKQPKRTSPNKTPSALRKHPSHLMDTDLPRADDPTPASPPPPIAESDLRACHICHSAPKRKTDLENYLQCQVCTERACYICARECYGGCKKQVCSKCCVQVGEDWDTYCLSCYQRNIRVG
jgi:hypothetical protein